MRPSCWMFLSELHLEGLCCRICPCVFPTNMLFFPMYNKTVIQLSSSVIQKTRFKPLLDLMKGQADSSRLWTWPRLRDSPDRHPNLGPDPADFDYTGILLQWQNYTSRRWEKSIRSSSLFVASVGLFPSAHFVNVLPLYLLNIWSIKTLLRILGLDL